MDGGSDWTFGANFFSTEQDGADREGGSGFQLWLWLILLRCNYSTDTADCLADVGLSWTKLILG